MKRLHIADTHEVRSGEVTDIYFVRTEEILKVRHLNEHVCMEVFLKSFPDESYRWGVFAGLEEVCTLLEGRPVTVYAVPEGTVFRPKIPVLVIEGNYLEFGEMETAILGCLCQASGISTRASRFRVAAGDKGLLSFGARRIHPSIAPMVERAAYIGGCDGVSTLAGARLIGEKPVGTMPHTLILIVGDTLTATLAFDEIIEKGIPRIALIDTFQDEKFEAIHVAEYMKERLSGVRLDTPRSRRGDFRAILVEVRWELDLRGHSHVRLVVSGGLGVEDVLDLKDAADAFGVGTQISSAATLDFSMDIVEIGGKPIAKRGKDSGRKSVLRCRSCMRDYVVPYGQTHAC
ncbi:MAG TPA: nicotinate phosphoribosyltransferase, partial [Deltaproteobacteria bacterium]|nr:nicotinate phosphoribosyltransferase [Deltaproteobacteria bacterium]